MVNYPKKSDYMTLKFRSIKHLPWSPGVHSDDKIAKNLDKLIGEQCIITEKLDGSNVMVSKHGVTSRGGNKNPWDENMWRYNSIFNRIRLKGPEHVLYFENLYAIHSIEYPYLTDHIHFIGMQYKNEFFPPSIDIEHELYKTPTVPILDVFEPENEKHIQEVVEEIMKEESVYGGQKEGIVIMPYETFKIRYWHQLVFKYVRANHVQTNKEWKKNWKRAYINSKL